MTHTILLAETDEDIRQCFPAMHALRPHLVAEEFVARVRRQHAAGYTLAVLRAANAVKSVAGFRIFEYLAWGTILYIDDFVTIPDEKRQGYGGQLLRWVVAHARSQGCDAVHLDSGYQRHDAHRLYLNTGFTLSSHHFALSLKEPAQ